MKKIAILLIILVVCANSYAKEIMICGKYKLTGYFDDGSPYSGVISVQKTDNGITVSGDINSYLSCLGTFGTDCVSYANKDLSVSISFCADGNISLSSLNVVVKDKNSQIGWSIKKVNEVKCKRLHV